MQVIAEAHPAGRRIGNGYRHSLAPREGALTFPRAAFNEFHEKNFTFHETLPCKCFRNRVKPKLPCENDHAVGEPGPKDKTTNSKAMLRSQTGPGGTQILVRPSRAAVGRPKHPACHLAPTCDDPDGRGCAVCLRLAVEEAQREGLGEKTEQALHHRRQFWLDTCREVREMRTASRQVLKLYRQQGWLFLCPAPRQAQSVLDALDSALPGWERDHPGLFYQTLELNFPELLRVSGAQRRS